MSTEREERKLFDSREEALEAIEGASSWPELFEHTWTALSSPRASWGDEPRQINAAMHAWSSAFFIVAAQDKTIFGDQGQARWVDGKQLVEASFSLAQYLATQLMRPMGVSTVEEENQPKRVGGLGWLPSSAFVTAIGSVMCQSNLLVKELLAKGGPAEGPPWSLGKLDESVLCGMSEWELDKAGFHDWNGEQVVDRPRQPSDWAGSASLKTRRHGTEAFEALRDAGGFRWVATGSMGGWENAVDCAKQMAQGCESLAAAIGMPGAAAAGIGSLGLAVNVYQSKSYAHFKSAHFLIATGPRPRSLGHEWTHALDHASQHWESCKEARARAVGAAQSAPRDLVAFGHLVRAMAYVARKPAMGVRKSVAAALAQEGQAPAEQAVEEVFAQVLDAAGHKEGKGIKMVAKALDKRSRLKREGANPAHKALFSEARVAKKEMEARGRKIDALVASGVSAYAAGSATLDDFQNRGDALYWSKDKERLARIGENFFSDRSKDPALLSGPDKSADPWPGDEEQLLWRFAHPVGSERDHAQKLFKSWLASCEPYLRELSAPRVPKVGAAEKLRARRKIALDALEAATPDAGPALVPKP
jgi:hypothetical protein